MLRKGPAGGFPTGPFVAIMKGRDRNALTLVEPD